MASYWGEVEIIQNWQSIEGNYTNVTANYYACADSYAGWSNYTTYPFLGLYHGADKTEESQTLTSFDFRKNKRILIGSITKNIPHNADGTMSVSASFTWDSDHSMVGTLTGYASKTLSTIPRASSITATDANIGSASIININRASDSFTHTVDYSFSGLSGRIATKTSQTSIGWSVPTSFFEKIPSAQSGTVTITCYTYSGNTHIGTKTTTMTVSVPTSGTYNSMPVIDSATAVDTNETTLALTGDSSRIVTYFSNVKINVTGRCLNYAGFSKLRERNVIDIPATTTTSNGTTNVTGEKIFEKNTSTEFRIVLVDTRQLASSYKYLNQANGDFKVVPYIPLTMSVEAKRVAPTSNSAILNFSGNFYNGYYDEAKKNFNDLTIKWRYKLRDSGSWITTGTDDTTNGWHNLTLNKDFKYNKNKFSSIDDIVIENIFDYQENYTIEIMYQDRLSSYITQQPILAGIPNHDYGVDVNGNNYFNVNGNIYANGKSILDLIYPVNSIYLSMSGIEPSTLFGGTWKRISEGRMLLGVGGSGEGGDNDIEGNTTNWCGELNNDYYSFGVGERGGQYFNTLTEAQMPSHYHRGLRYSGNDKKIQMNSGGSQYNLSWGGSGSDGDDEIYTESKGSGEAHNNMPPYLAVYIWQRTA